MTKKKLLCITGAVVFSAGIIAAAVFLLPNTAAPVVSTQSYEQLMANGGIDIGYKILDVKKVNPRFGQADGYAFIIDYNDQAKTIEVDEATYSTYKAGDYITCAYLLDGTKPVIAAKPVGNNTEVK